MTIKMDMLSLSFVLLFLWIAFVNANPNDIIRDDRYTCTKRASKILDITKVIWLNQDDDFMLKELPPFAVPRPTGSTNIKRVRQHIGNSFSGLNWTLEYDVSNQRTVLGMRRFVNVIATQKIQAPKRIILACHYESKLYPRGFVGAIDSAVPCAMLVHVARKFNNMLQMINSTTTIQILFLDGEEAFVLWTPVDSLYGSKHLAKTWAAQKDRHDLSKNNLQNIDAFILLDLIGHPRTRFQRFYRETDNMYSMLIELESCFRYLKLLQRPANAHPLFLNSRRRVPIDDDHAPFLKRGVSNIMHLITSPFPSTWHTMRDNVDSLDVAIINDFNKIFGAFVMHVAINAV